MCAVIRPNTQLLLRRKSPWPSFQGAGTAAGTGQAPLTTVSGDQNNPLRPDQILTPDLQSWEG